MSTIIYDTIVKKDTDMSTFIYEFKASTNFFDSNFKTVKSTVNLYWNLLDSFELSQILFTFLSFLCCNAQYFVLSNGCQLSKWHFLVKISFIVHWTSERPKKKTVKLLMLLFWFKMIIIKQVLFGNCRNIAVFCNYV